MSKRKERETEKSLPQARQSEIDEQPKSSERNAPSKKEVLIQSTAGNGQVPEECEIGKSQPQARRSGIDEKESDQSSERNAPSKEESTIKSNEGNVQEFKVPIGKAQGEKETHHEETASIVQSQEKPFKARGKRSGKNEKRKQEKREQLKFPERPVFTNPRAEREIMSYISESSVQVYYREGPIGEREIVPKGGHSPNSSVQSLEIVHEQLPFDPDFKQEGRQSENLNEPETKREKAPEPEVKVEIKQEKPPERVWPSHLQRPRQTSPAEPKKMTNDDYDKAADQNTIWLKEMIQRSKELGYTYPLLYRDDVVKEIRKVGWTKWSTSEQAKNVGGIGLFQLLTMDDPDPPVESEPESKTETEPSSSQEATSTVVIDEFERETHNTETSSSTEGNVITFKLDQALNMGEISNLSKEEEEKMSIERIISGYDKPGTSWPRETLENYPNRKELIDAEIEYFTKKVAVMHDYPPFKLHDYKGEGKMGRANRQDWPAKVSQAVNELAAVWKTLCERVKDLETWWIMSLGSVQTMPQAIKLREIINDEGKICNEAIKRFIERVILSVGRVNNPYKTIEITPPDRAQHYIDRIHESERLLQISAGAMGELTNAVEEKAKLSPKQAITDGDIAPIRDSVLTYVRLHGRSRHMINLLTNYPKLLDTLRPDGDMTAGMVRVWDGSSFAKDPRAKAGGRFAVLASEPPSRRESTTTVAMEQGSTAKTDEPMGSIDEGGKDPAQKDAGEVFKPQDPDEGKFLGTGKVTSDDEGEEKDPEGIKRIQYGQSQFKVTEEDEKYLMEQANKDLEYLCKRGDQFTNEYQEDVMISYYYIFQRSQVALLQKRPENAEDWRSMIPSDVREEAFKVYIRWQLFASRNHDLADAMENERPALWDEWQVSEVKAIQEEERRRKEGVALAAMAKPREKTPPRQQPQRQQTPYRQPRRMGSQLGSSRGGSFAQSQSQAKRSYQFEMSPVRPGSTQLGRGFASSTRQSSTASKKTIPQRARNNLPNTAVMAGNREITLELERDFSPDYISMETDVEYRIIRSGANYALGAYEPSLNPYVERMNYDVPMLMQFSKKDSPVEMKFTTGETVKVQRYTMMKVRNVELPFQSKFESLDRMVDDDGYLVSNQFCIRNTRGTVARGRVHGSMCIVETSKKDISKKTGLENWEISVHTSLQWEVINVSSYQISYQLKDLPKRGDIVCLDGVLITPDNRKWYRNHCYFSHQVPDSKKVENGVIAIILGANRNIHITDDLIYGWTEEDQNTFRTKHRLSSELGAALMSFEGARLTDSLKMANADVSSVEYIEDFVYRVRVDMRKVESQAQLRAISAIAGNVVVYEKRRNMRDEVQELPVFQGYIDDTEFSNEVVESFIVRHFVDPGNPRWHIEGADPVEELPTRERNLKLDESVRDVCKVDNTVTAEWSMKFVESLVRKGLYIRSQDDPKILQRVHNLMRTLKMDWNLNTRNGELKSILNGHKIQVSPFSWPEAKRGKDNETIGNMIGLERRERHLAEGIEKDPNMDPGQKKAITDFLVKHVPVIALEAFGGSGKTFTIANCIVSVDYLQDNKGFLLVTSKTNKSVKVIAQELGKSKKLKANDVLLVQSVSASMKKIEGNAAKFTMEEKAKALVEGGQLSHDEHTLLSKYVSIRERNIQLAKDTGMVRRIIFKYTKPKILLTTTDMGLLLGGITKETTRWICDEGSLAEDGKVRAFVAMMPKLEGILIAGDPGQIEPFSHIREKLNIKRFGLGPMINQMIMRNTSTIISLEKNRRSIPSLLPPIMATSVRYGIMIPGKNEPDWANDPTMCYPPMPVFDVPYLVIDCDGMHEITATGSVRNREQERIAEFYVHMVNELVRLKAIPEESIIMLNFYQGSNIHVREAIAKFSIKGSINVTTVDSAMGEQGDTAISVTSRAELMSPFSDEGTEVGSPSFVHHDPRVRVAVGRPKKRHVFIGRMDFCTQKDGALRNFLRTAVQTTPVLDGKVFIEMYSEWLKKVTEVLESGGDIDLDPPRYENNLLYRDMVNGNNPTDFSHIANCRLNQEFGWLDKTKSLHPDDVPKDYVKPQFFVNYNEKTSDLAASKERLQMMKGKERPAKVPSASEKVHTEQDVQMEVDADETIIDPPEFISGGDNGQEQGENVPKEKEGGKD